MADFILPILLIVGGVFWSFLRMYADMMRPVPLGWGPGYAGPAVALAGVAWLAHSVSGLIG
ncbi:MAG: hypothetical protein QMD99_02120 [Rhizobiaceae bacterium]|nr:hypothetical protein [Rhizobiaceae bacterium]